MDHPTRIGYSTLAIVFVIAFLLGYGTSARLVMRPAGELVSEEENEMSEGEVAVEQKESIVGEETSLESSMAKISLSLGTGINTVSADSQPAGNTVSVAVKLEKETWVAVHEEAAGKPGRILGAQLFTAGTHFGKVDLLRGTVVGGKYYAMLHADDGDRKFDLAKDQPLVTGAGAAITDEFTATAGAAVQ